MLKTADLIVEAVQSKSHEESSKYFRLIKTEERNSDSVQNEIFDELNKTFITPFDREDIHSLSSRMDDVIDLINSCAKRIMLYSPKTMPDSAKQLAESVKKAAECLAGAIAELSSLKKNPARITDYCDQLSDLEHDADDVYEHFLIDLFQNEKDPFEVIKLKEILHELERATDAAETVGKIIKTIIVKYA